MTAKELTAKFIAIPEDAQWYACGAHPPYGDCLGLLDRGMMDRAIRAHEQVCLTCPPAPDRVPYAGGESPGGVCTCPPDASGVCAVICACIDPTVGLDGYIRAFVDTYCAMDRLDHAEVVTVN